MQMVNIIILISASVGVIIYFTCCLRPLMREAAARGTPWRMYPVCFLGDYFERRLMRKRTEKDRLLSLVRHRTPSHGSAAPAPSPAMPQMRRSDIPPPPLGLATLLPTYAGRVCPSSLGPNGELFLFVEKPLVDATGNEHVEIATTVIVPPQARPFIEQCIADGSLWQASCVPAHAQGIRMRILVKDKTARWTPLQEWVVCQARAWRPTPAAPRTPLPFRKYASPLIAAAPPHRGGVFCT